MRLAAPRALTHLAREGRHQQVALHIYLYLFIAHMYIVINVVLLSCPLAQ